MSFFPAFQEGPKKNYEEVKLKVQKIDERTIPLNIKGKLTILYYFNVYLIFERFDY